MSNVTGTQFQPTASRRDPFGTLVAWALLAMGVVVFASCVLFPAWQSLEALKVAERIEQSRIDAMEARIEEDRRLLVALRNDPVVIARLARRDLRMNVTNDQWVPVDVPGESGPPKRYFDPPPDIASILAEQTPRTDSEARLAAVLTNDRNRLTLLAMSVTLIGVAMWLPTRRMSG